MSSPVPVPSRGDRRQDNGEQGSDIYELERIKGGRHAAIMRYNLQT